MKYYTIFVNWRLTVRNFHKHPRTGRASWNRGTDFVFVLCCCFLFALVLFLLLASLEVLPRDQPRHNKSAGAVQASLMA